MFAASKSGSADAKDPQFNYVTMLLHGNGTNGAQNNTFVDSSTNNFTITRNGNTTQGTFSPYGSNWSNYFDGTSNSNYLSIPRLLDSNVDITLECWINMSAAEPAAGAYIAAQFVSGGADRTLFIVSSNVLALQIGSTFVTGTIPIGIGKWNHVAWVRSGNSTNNWSIYVNGVRDGQMTYTGTYQNTPFTIGATNNLASTQFPGYISNLRLLKGTALYSGSSFTPPTAPLTAITNTVLLTCADNRFIDDSSSPKTITVNGSPSVQRFSPFSPTSAYSTSVIGGSGYFDGTGDYLSAGSSISLSGDFTVEGWIYRTTASGNGNYVFGLGNDTFSGGATFFVDTSGYLRIYTSQAHLLAGTSGLAQLNSWNHIAFVRSSNTLRAYLNGVQVDSASWSATISGTAYINAELNGNPTATVYFGSAGYISNSRIGTTAVYTTAFTPPTAPLTAITGTQLLLSYTNAGILDNAMMNDLETVGNAQISTSVKKYGTGSLYFDGTGDWMFAPDSPSWDFGTGDFTLEGWIYPTTSSSVRVLWSAFSDSGDNGWSFELTSSDKLTFYAEGAYRVTSTSSVSANTWTHIAVSRSGSSLKLFINGTTDGTATNSTDISGSTAKLTIAATPSGTVPFTGYIDELRITKGYARYTATFTPPTAPFPDRG